MIQRSNQQFDVIISGGGLSGTLMALSLSKLTKADGSALSIAVIEAQAFQQDRPIDSNALFDARVLALSHGSANYLAELGVWQYLKDRACAITDIDISDRGHFAKARLSAKEHNVNALGYVIDMALIGKAQLTALKSNSHVHWFSPDTITEVDWHKESSSPPFENDTDYSLTITLKSGTQLASSLLIGCDGVHSPVRQLANIGISCSDYQQVALIANVSTAKPHHNKAYERFTEFGPIAMLPLSEVNGVPHHHNAAENNLSTRFSLVWTMTPGQAEAITKLDDESFKVELEKAFGSYLGAITHVGKRDMYPLKLLQAQQQIYKRMALVGNSSHTIHPVAGQGFNLGLRDVKILSDLINQALAENQDIGGFSLLHEYQNNRVKDQQQIIGLTDSLISLFANDFTPLVIGRNIGLQALNILPSVKNALVKKTMGY